MLRSVPFLLAVGILLAACPAQDARAFGWPSRAVRVDRQLSSQARSEREAAAQRLLELPRATALSLLPRALGDEDESVRLVAARAAVLLGARGQGSVVEGWLRETSAPLRRAALAVLAIQLEPELIPVVVRASFDADETVRAAAMRCLGRATLGASTEVQPTLVRALDDPSPLVRTEALESLGRQGEPGIVSALAARLGDPEVSVRRSAAVALGAVGSSAAAEPLILALADPATEVAGAAARSLGEIGSPGVAASLERVLGGAVFGPVQAASVEALARLRTPEAYRALLGRMADREAAPLLHELLTESVPSAALTSELEGCLAQAGGLGLLECARVAATLGVPLETLVVRARRGELPSDALFDAAPGTRDQELLILAVERLGRGTALEKRAALGLLERSQPLPEPTARLLVAAVDARGSSGLDAARLLWLVARAPAVAAPPEILDGARLLAASTRPVERSMGLAVLAAQATEPQGLLAPLEAGGVLADVTSAFYARGLDPQQSKLLVRALEERRAVPPANALRALAGLSPELDGATVERLAALGEAAQGPTRDALLATLGNQKVAGAHLRRVLRDGPVLDRRLVSAFLPFREALGNSEAEELVALALSDVDPWVQVHGARAAGAGQVPELSRLVRSGPDFLRSAALFELARVAPEQAAKSFPPCDDASLELGPRLATLVLAKRTKSFCDAHVLADVVLGSEEPLLREVAARALYARSPEHRALRVCRVYEVEPLVALACGGMPPRPFRAESSPAGPADRTGFSSPFRALPFTVVSVLAPWPSRSAGGAASDAAPSTPYAMMDSSESIRLGFTDRLGRAFVPVETGVSRFLDARLSL